MMASTIARQHARGIGHGLAAAELHFLRGQHDRFAAELTHADVERDARAGRRLVEDHRQGLAGQRRRQFAALARRLHGRGCWHRCMSRTCLPEYRSDRGSGGCRLLIRRSLLWRRPARGCASSAMQARSIRAIASAISASLTISGGSRRTTLSPAATVIISSVRSSSTISPSGGPSHEADQQAFAAHLGDHRRMPVLASRRAAA